MSQKIKKAIKLSLMTQIVNEKRDKIEFTCDLAPILLRRQEGMSYQEQALFLEECNHATRCFVVEEKGAAY